MYLKLENISKIYFENKATHKKAIDNISFELEKAKLLCLLGPSGCGKSTILKAIGGFIKINSGKIILDKKDITNEPPETRNVSTVFQSYGLFTHMNVLANIIYGLKFKNISKKEQIKTGLQLMEKIGLNGYEKKLPVELSGGEQQRVAIARSLIIKPKLLLLDEPLSNLDAKLRISMRQEIKRLQKEFNITMIFVTHDQSEAFEIADKIILMNKGKIEQTDSPENLYNKPNNTFVLDFIGSNNKIDEYFVRPEMIKVYKVPPKNIKTKKAVIKNIIFKGDLSELHLRQLKNKPKSNLKHIDLKAVVLNSGDNYKIGAEVFIQYECKMV